MTENKFPENVGNEMIPDTQDELNRKERIKGHAAVNDGLKLLLEKSNRLTNDPAITASEFKISLIRLYTEMYCLVTNGIHQIMTDAGESGRVSEVKEQTSE